MTHPASSSRQAIIFVLPFLLASLPVATSEENEFGLDHETYSYYGVTRYNYIGCSDGSKIPAMFEAYGPRISHAHDAALALHDCMFIESGMAVLLHRPGETVQLEGLPVKGYFITPRALAERNDNIGEVWYPFEFLKDVEVWQVLKEPEFDPTDVPDIEGDLPIGRWVVWRNFNVEDLAKSNRGNFAAIEAAWEVREDGTGNYLKIHGNRKPENGIRFPAGKSNVWTIDTEFRWRIGDPSRDSRDLPTFTEQTWQEQTHAISYSLGNDFFVLSPPTGDWWDDNLLVVRIGSDLFWDIIRFRDCIKNNKGIKLHEVIPCSPSPLIDDDGNLMPYPIGKEML